MSFLDYVRTAATILSLLGVHTQLQVRKPTQLDVRDDIRYRRVKPGDPERDSTCIEHRDPVKDGSDVIYNWCNLSPSQSWAQGRYDGYETMYTTFNGTDFCLTASELKPGAPLVMSPCRPESRHHGQRIVNPACYNGIKFDSPGRKSLCASCGFEDVCRVVICSIPDPEAYPDIPTWTDEAPPEDDLVLPGDETAPRKPVAPIEQCLPPDRYFKWLELGKPRGLFDLNQIFVDTARDYTVGTEYLLENDDFALAVARTCRDPAFAFYEWLAWPERGAALHYLRDERIQEFYNSSVPCAIRLFLDWPAQEQLCPDTYPPLEEIPGDRTVVVPVMFGCRARRCVDARYPCNQARSQEWNYDKDRNQLVFRREDGREMCWHLKDKGGNRPPGVLISECSDDPRQLLVPVPAVGDLVGVPYTGGNTTALQNPWFNVCLSKSSSDDTVRAGACT